MTEFDLDPQLGDHMPSVDTRNLDVIDRLPGWRV
jgi:hypothetical protein